MPNPKKPLIRAVVSNDKITKGGSISPTSPASFIDVPKPQHVQKPISQKPKNAQNK